MSQGVSLPRPSRPPFWRFQSRRERRASALDVVRAAELPENVSALVLLVVKRCRLWREERVEVARELCGHFAEGLSRGETASDLIGAFGEPKGAARLITRAKKRCRPAWWKALRDARRAAGVVLAVSLAWYGYHAARFYLGRPVVRFSTVSKINEASHAVPVSERAWPIYRDAYLTVRGEGADNWPKGEHGQDLNVGHRHRLSAAERASVIAFARAHQPQVEAFRRAAAMERGGFIISGATDETYRESLRGEVQRDGGTFAFGILLPQLGAYRKAGQILAMDALRASEDGETGTAVADVRAMLGAARHATEDGTLVAQSVGCSLLNDACAIARELATGNRPLTEQQIVDLIHAFSAYRVSAAHAERIDTSLERLAFEDLLQRVYTDDGRGNGHLTAACMRLEAFGSRRSSGLEAWAGPALSGIVADRKQMKAAHERLMEAIEQQISLPLHARDIEAVNTRATEVRGGVFGGGGAALVKDLTSMYVFSQKNADMALAQRDAAVAGLGCELYKLRNGRYPANLDGLVPTILPRVPTDRWTGRGLCYRIDAGELDPGRPLIYSAGDDRADDGGVFTRFGNTERWQGKDIALWPTLPPPPAEPAGGDGSVAALDWSWMWAFWGR